MMWNGDAMDPRVQVSKVSALLLASLETILNQLHSAIQGSEPRRLLKLCLPYDPLWSLTGRWDQRHWLNLGS